MCHKFGLGSDFIADKYIPFHICTTSPHLGHERDVEYGGVAGYDFLAEFYIIYFHEIGRVAGRIFYRIEGKQTAGLGHCLDEQDTGNDGLLGEMSLKERLVAGEVFNSYDVVFPDFYNFVDEQHRVAVR